jgi:hypothetical protein
MGQIPGSGSELPGLAGLGSLLLAMYVGGPATMRLGPLVVSHTAGGMFRGIVLTGRGGANPRRGRSQLFADTLRQAALSADTLRQAAGRAA